MSEESLVFVVRLVAIVLILAALGLVVWNFWMQRKIREEERRRMPPPNGAPSGEFDAHYMDSINGGEGALPRPETNLPLTIMARHGQYFTGEQIEKLVKKFDFERTPTGLYILRNDKDEVSCTLCKVKRPAEFPEDLRSLDRLEGLLLNLHLPQGENPLRDWEMFNDLAHEMTQFLDGRLCDYKREPLGDAGLVRYRETVNQFVEELLAWRHAHIDS